jgi:DNA-binding Lrp family transcriptional regulator
LAEYFKKLIQWIREGGGRLRQSLEWLAGRMRVSERTVMRWNAELEKLGLLRVFRAKLTPILNALNIYTLITKRRDTNVTLKNKDLKTTTPAGASSAFERAREQFRAERRAHDAKVSAQMRAAYAMKGEAWLKAAYDRTRRAVLNTLGAADETYTNPWSEEKQRSARERALECVRQQELKRVERLQWA